MSTAAALGAGTLLLAVTPTQGAAERSTPSGYPVPRYLTLKFATVNARSGPGDDHRLLWVYHARGLPVQVVAETAEWRRICDPEGGVAWVHRRVTDGRRGVINTAERPAPLYRKPKVGAAVTAYLGARSIGALDRCQKGWCKVKAGGETGWVREGALWGTAETLQCR